MKVPFKLILSLLSFVALIFLSSCATYYQRNIKFQEAFTQGKLEEAQKILDKKSEKTSTGKNRLLYFIQKGVVLQMQGKFEESNASFEQAYYFTEDYSKKIGGEALSLIANPMMKPYAGEDHEVVLIHYYKALNYLQLHQPQKALVEARRLNNKLNVLNDKYQNKNTRYKDDAFAHTLMGLAYEQDKDWNNAFIAYRNAYDTYKNEYASAFGVEAPLQLKKDLLKTAALMGFDKELRQYEEEFNLKYVSEEQSAGELLFFWHNGLGPVKDEWSINFTTVRGAGGMATFVNEELGLNFSFPLPQNEQEKNNLGDLKVIRVAFPKYHERKPYYQSAVIAANQKQYPLEVAENVNAIAFAVLQDRMMRELGNSLMRLAVKQAMEYAVRQENESAGALVGLVNAMTEKADTRNWQTLPYSMSYTKVPLREGNNEIKLKMKAPNGQITEETFNFVGENNIKYYHVFHSLESL